MQQQELRVLAAMSPPRMLDDDVISRLPSRHAAIVQCVNSSGLPNTVIAERLGMCESQVSRVLRGTRSWDERRTGLLMQVCGNYAPLQWEAKAHGFALLPASQVAAIQHMTQAIQQIGRAA
jgi:hypothetical protein